MELDELLELEEFDEDELELDELDELLELEELELVSSPPQAVSRANTSAAGASVRMMIPLKRGLLFFATT